MKILGIETSCDETSLAIIEAENGIFEVRTNIVSSQSKIHAKYGGVVPEVAARQHAENFMGVLDMALRKARVKEQDIDLIACVCGPGLVTSLLVGSAAAKTFAFVLKKPLVPVNHMKGHIYANFLTPPLGLSCKKWEQDPKLFLLSKNSPTTRSMGRLGEVLFPALCLVVSGGHTELVLMRGIERFKKIGETLDDAAGECFDKVAKMLDLPYPGGPQISQHSKAGNPHAYHFPRPMLDQENYNFSFAGLKTSVLYFLRDHKISTSPSLDELKSKVLEKGGKKILADVCASVEQAIVDTLIGKSLRALKEYHVKTIMLAGGVAANQRLRQQMEQRLRDQFPEVVFMKPALQFCTDNAAMAAVAGYFQYLTSKNKKTFLRAWKSMKVDPNMDIA